MYIYNFCGDTVSSVNNAI